MADVDNPLGFVKSTDPEVYALMQREYARQESGLELIASEVSASCQPSECRARARRRCPSRC